MTRSAQASLWPSTLKASSRIDFKAFLRTQAQDLKKLVNGVLDVSVEVRIVESVIIYNFVITLPTRDYRYQLFSVRMFGGDFPARIVAPHMPEHLQVIPVADKNELEQKLKEMFHHQNTTKVVLTLENEERDALGADGLPPA
jgi:hypothetical protein